MQVTQTRFAKDLPFREVLASFETDDGAVWMVLPSHICRNNGHDLDCFPIKTQGIESAFVAEGRYIIFHNLSRSHAAYFDTKTMEFEDFPWCGDYSLIYHHDYKESLYVTDYISISKYEFQNKNITNTNKSCTFINQIPNIKYQLSDGQNVQFLEDRIILNGKRIHLPVGKNIEYGQAFMINKNLIISNGEVIFVKKWNDTDFKELYRDEKFCKKIFVDQKGQIIINVHKKEICRYSEKIFLVDLESFSLDDLSYLIPSEFDSTVSHIGGRDFSKKILLSSYQGFKLFEKNTSVFQSTLKIKKNTGFGRILKGITTDDEGNIWSAGEVRNIYKINKMMEYDTFTIKINIGDTLVNLSFSRNLIFDKKRKWLWNICGSYVKNESIIYAWDIDQKKVTYSLPVRHRLWSFNQVDNTLIIATNRENILRFDMNSICLDTLLTLEKKDEPETRVLFSDGDYLYIGGKGGLWTYRFSTKKIDRFEDLKEAQIYSIHKNKDVIYLGTLEGLWVYHLKSKMLEKYNIKSGLSNNYITSCKSISDDRLLVSTFKGINLIDLKHKLVTSYFSKDGLSDDECNFIASHDDDTRIYIGTINGMTIINKDRLKVTHNAIPTIYKRQIRGFGIDQIKYENGMTKLNFDPDVQKMIIYLESPEKSDKIKYAIRFYNQDTSWTRLDDSELEILRTRHKNIRLDIKCTDVHGVWSSGFLTVNAVMHDYWYKSPWLYLLLTMMISISLYYWFRSQQIKDKKNLQLLISLENQAQEYKLQALQSQMNPHFLFNAMSAIQYLIHTKNIHKADDYLTSFGALIRMILESSKVQLWTLEEEIKMLKLYCNLEQERFEDDNIDVNIQYADDIDLMNIRILPMIIQPFVENVFNHAFQNLQYKPVLKITFRDVGDYIHVSIVDNGIGIQNSNSLKSDFLKIKKSRGLEITKERIANFNRLHDQKIYYKISDAFDNKQLSGTKVDIHWPYL